MSRERFIDNLRLASRLLASPKVVNGHASEDELPLHRMMRTANLWLTPKTVADFDPEAFAYWTKNEREALAKHIAAFLTVAETIPANSPASPAQSEKARKSLEAVIQTVRPRLLAEWIQAQESMIQDATTAAEAKGWYVERDQKEMKESLLGTYSAPRLRIRAKNKEVVLDPIALFGSGRRGVVDLVLMPTYETKYLVTFKDGNWQIVAPHGKMHTRPFSAATLVNTISQLSRT